MSDEQINESWAKLPKAPIVEAVLDIDCALRPGHPVSDLERPAREAYRDHYPKTRVQLIQQHRIEAQRGAPPQFSVEQGLQAYQFLHDDERQLVQVRVQGYSFNRLAPYTTLDDYLPEIQRTWELFLRIASPVDVRAIRLRYINRIVLPMESGRADLDEYLRIGPRLPDEESLMLIGFLSQNAAVERETGNQLITVLTHEPQQRETLPIILDITASYAVQPLDPNNWAEILARVQSLRDLKNRAFRNTLTSRCLKLFQP
jgi:uncharacterized protein (TIGR04255 family)